MDDKRQRTLQNLQRELQAVQSTDPLAKERIETLNNQISHVIGGPSPTLDRPEELPALQNSIQEAIAAFESYHPQLAEALRIAINTLVNAGI
ncbi:MAG: DUF4404 family protein [Anaerolineaceae bacterium]|nr:DUF4404 family protein [Anaerolineaceae bacterium]